eukprot:CAMPEP_0178579112 /NCGR_PEP_ID=MMETSP0697-20121206/21904_1 /TAXON_ID=265572 /ORGANISM="Extubocellulus spinifer, Strain CCMP396" /LENGTH=318 /DNA_ID=CAMNT_0020214529 /DNA_START=138 /DNA_END=1094 /DNA_ORIENTATION=-
MPSVRRRSCSPSKGGLISSVAAPALMAVALLLGSQEVHAFNIIGNRRINHIHAAVHTSRRLHPQSLSRHVHVHVLGRRPSSKLLAVDDANNDTKKPIMEDPNPGGLNNYGGSDDGDTEPADEPNFIQQFQSWLGSEEGKRDIQTYTISLSFALLLRVLIIEPRYIPSLSMYPTFDVGDQLAVEKVSKRIRPMGRKEVVVFNPPQTFRDIMNANYGSSNKKSKEALIKRIVAVEGDTVKVTGGKLYVNDEKQDEPFTAEDAAYEFGPVQVPLGSVLVLGDNRNHSLDGHIWGFLPRENVIGRAVFVYWPPWRIGTENLF